MELNKYYTPELEEIFNSPELIYSENIHINPYVYRDETKIINLKEDFDINIVKVKYLDQEDIESLGFIKDKTIDNYWKLNNIVLRIKNFKISIYVYDDYTVDKLIFEGIIKNKSELIKLLKQLNINEIK